MRELRFNVPKDKVDAVIAAVEGIIGSQEPPAERYSVAVVNLTRERPSENQVWTDTVYMVIPAADFSRSMNLVVYMDELIARYLRTKEGWLSNVEACEDYNWGDFIMDMPLEKYGLHLDGSICNRADEIVTCDRVVDQDQLLAVGVTARGVAKLYNGDELLYQSEAEVDFYDGYLKWDDEPSEDTVSVATRGVFTVEDGDEFALCKDEEFSRLSGDDDEGGENDDE